jgi:hypothetical protein
MNTCFDVALKFVNESDQEIQDKIKQANKCSELITTTKKTTQTFTTRSPTTESSCEEELKVYKKKSVENERPKEMKMEADYNRNNFLLNSALILESLAISIMLIVCFLLFKKINELYRIIQGMI